MYKLVDGVESTPEELSQEELTFYSGLCLDLLAVKVDEVYPNLKQRFEDYARAVDRMLHLHNSPEGYTTENFYEIYRLLIEALQYVDDHFRDTPFNKFKSRIVGEVFPEEPAAFNGLYRQLFEENKEDLAVKAAAEALVLGEISAGIEAIRPNIKERVICAILDLLSLPHPGEEDYNTSGVEALLAILDNEDDELVSMMGYGLDVVVNLLIEARILLMGLSDEDEDVSTQRFEKAKPALIVHAPQDNAPFLYQV